MTNHRRIGLMALILALGSPVHAQTTPAAGRIKTVTGSAFFIRQKDIVPAKAGQPVFESDGLKTGADGYLGVVLKDDTLLSLGPNSEIHLDRFVYAPGEGRLALALRIARGVIAYVSGRIAKLSPDAVRLETPSAIVGVRGTRLAIRVEPQ
jgi:hypothetical protein